MWAGGAPGTGADSLAACGEDHDVAPILAMDDHIRKCICSAAHREPHATGSGCVLKEAAGHGEPTGTGSWNELWTIQNSSNRQFFFLAGTVSNEGPTVELSVPEGLYPTQKAHSGAAREELQPVGRTCTGAAGEGWYPEGEPPLWRRDKCEEEGVVERSCYKQHGPSSLHCLGWEGGRRLRIEGVKLRLGRGPAGGKRF